MKGPIITSPQLIPFARPALAYMNGQITRAEYDHLIRLASLNVRATRA
jgi:hypothetical protein